MTPIAIVTFILGIVSFQSAPASSPNAAFVADVLHSLKDVHDTRNVRAIESVPARESWQGVALVLHRAGDAIAQRMTPWHQHADSRIRDVAAYLTTAAGSLKAMGAMFDGLSSGRDDPESAYGRFRGERERLEIMLLSTGLLAANRDHVNVIALTTDEKQRIIRLIDESLFPEEMKAYARADASGGTAPVLEPDLFVVLAFRNLYRDDLSGP